MRARQACFGGSVLIQCEQQALTTRAPDMVRMLTLLGILIAAPTLGQEGPSFNCSQAESSAKELICTDAEMAALDRRLATRYADALEAARGLDAGAMETEEQLLAYQRGWIKGRDECWKSTDLRDCVEASYLQREGELVANWLLEDPTHIAFWTCGGNTANEVVTYFFDTELPSVRFERGDAIATGYQIPTGSGSRFEGNFGRSIWIKGEEATYREPDPDGSTFECVLARQE